MNLLPWFTADGHVFSGCAALLFHVVSLRPNAKAIRSQALRSAHPSRMAWGHRDGQLEFMELQGNFMGKTHGKILRKLWPMFPPVGLKR